MDEPTFIGPDQAPRRSDTKNWSRRPNGDGWRQYCPRCGCKNVVRGQGKQFKCTVCTWLIWWQGPLWGRALRG